jgi:diguanylate cyclase (GGDEF)-like protein
MTLDFNGKVVNATSSIGVAVYPEDGDKQDTLFKSADLALYAAKNGGRNTWRAFDAELGS